MIDATETEYHRILKSGTKAALEKQTWTCSGCGSAAAQQQYHRQRRNEKLEPDAYLGKNNKKPERQDRSNKGKGQRTGTRDKRQGKRRIPFGRS